MRIRILGLALAATVIAAAATPVDAQARGRQADTPNGYLCCNMRAYDGEAYDINYENEGDRILAFGSPVALTGQSARKLRMRIGGERYVLENHYSRDLDEAAFVARYVLAEDPRVAAASFPAHIRQAIEAGQVTPGMTREQVRMSLGWPISSENPDLDAPVWRYWLSSFDEIQVEFDDSGHVVDLTASALTRRRLWLP
jgi:hypothetical protein